MDALIGYSGFVGGQLQRQHSFTSLFNSSNIDQVGAAEFDTVVCAAAPGSMFEANMLPDVDLSKVNALIEHLETIKTKRFVLISSIAVLANFAAHDDENTSAFQTKLAYGKHRHVLEAFCEDHFDDCLVIRLPALFGEGLRKNFIFDLINPLPTLLTTDKLSALRNDLGSIEAELLDKIYSPDPNTGMQKIDRAELAKDKNRKSLETAVTELGYSSTHFHNRETTYQYYDMKRLWSDITIAEKENLKILHLAMPPLRAADIHKRLLGFDMPETNARLHKEDMYTAYAHLWGRNGPYLDDAETIMSQLKFFYRKECKNR